MLLYQVHVSCGYRERGRLKTSAKGLVDAQNEQSFVYVAQDLCSLVLSLAKISSQWACINSVIPPDCPLGAFIHRSYHPRTSVKKPPKETPTLKILIGL